MLTLASSSRSEICPPRRHARQRQLLDLLSVLVAADPRFLSHSTGMDPLELGWHISALAQAGYLAAVDSQAGLVSLTERGRLANDADRRWRFRAATVVLLSALSRHHLG